MQVELGEAGELDLQPLSDAIAGLSGAGARGLTDFERAWRVALLGGAPAALAAQGLQAWLAELARAAVAPQSLAVAQQWALHAAGRACELLRQSNLGSDSLAALEEILRAAEPGAQTGVLMLGLPEFLELPCSAHRQWQVELAQAVAARLRPADWLLQVSTRDWLLLMPGVHSAAQLPLAAQALSSACAGVLAQHFGAQQSAICVGAALAPERAQSAPALLAAARTALAQARAQGEAFLLSEAASGEACDDQALGLEFARALQTNALLLHYQPQVRLHDEACIAVEALLRWRSAAGEWIAPPRLIAMAERLGLLPRLCDWLIAEACRVLAALTQAGHSLRVAINLTATDFYDVDLPERVVQLTHTWGVSPAQLVIEVTETILIVRPQRARAVFDALRVLGCRISLDDFGTGYSSLAYLRELPVDEVKIDRCFITDVIGNPRDAAIVRSIVALGGGLGLNVVAEGAETREVIDWLSHEGCSVVQGYGFARPMAFEDLLRWLNAPLANSVGT
ncbi:hypothetical protein GCM10027046_33740 [Uliginosibacterium flavum]